jgi:hypothetical protein
MLLGGMWSLNLDIEATFSHQNIITISGLLNVWANFCMLLVGCYLLVFYFKEISGLSFFIGEFNKVVIILTLIVSSVLAIGLYAKSKWNVKEYVECKGLREISTRYSSRTYTITQELCDELVEKKRN